MRSCRLKRSSLGGIWFAIDMHERPPSIIAKRKRVARLPRSPRPGSLQQHPHPDSCTFIPSPSSRNTPASNTHPWMPPGPVTSSPIPTGGCPPFCPPPALHSQATGRAATWTAPRTTASVHVGVLDVREAPCTADPLLQAWGWLGSEKSSWPHISTYHSAVSRCG